MEDHGQPDYSMQVVSTGSCLAFLWVYKLSKPIMTACVGHEYTKLSPGKQVDWDSRVMSIVHALVVCAISIYLLLYDNAIADDPMWGSSTLARANCAITVGYMSADLITMMWHYKDVGSVLYLLHHSAIIYAYYNISTYGIFLTAASWRVLAELSTPFVNGRWFLSTLNYPKNDRLYILNGISMLLSFLLVRILVIPLHWHNLALVAPQSFEHFGTVASYLFCSVCLILDVLNVFWFSKLVRGLVKFMQVDEKNFSKYEKKNE